MSKHNFFFDVNKLIAFHDVPEKLLPSAKAHKNNDKFNGGHVRKAVLFWNPKRLFSREFGVRT